MAPIDLRFGVIGMSEGNGHPYSWSAICNGYNADAMRDCGFPVIPVYLGQQMWPAARLSGTCVSHIWTQDAALSRRIAAGSLIPNVVDTPSEMLGEIDGLLLARDDAENHLEFARPFLEAGLPVYIDKPVALSDAALESLFSCCQREGQIFSCSALRFASELSLTDEEISSVGEIRRVIGVTPKSWRKYAIHLIDPVLKEFEASGLITPTGALELEGDGRLLAARVKDGPELVFIAAGNNATTGPIEIRYIGSEGSVRKDFQDPFTAFRSALQAFAMQVRTGSDTTPIERLRPMVRLLQAGLSI